MPDELARLRQLEAVAESLLKTIRGLISKYECNEQEHRDRRHLRVLGILLPTALAGLAEAARKSPKISAALAAGTTAVAATGTAALVVTFDSDEGRASDRPVIAAPAPTPPATSSPSPSPRHSTTPTRTPAPAAAVIPQTSPTLVLSSPTLPAVDSPAPVVRRPRTSAPASPSVRPPHPTSAPPPVKAHPCRVPTKVPRPVRDRICQRRSSP
jgi:hypothetical protein